MIGLIKWPRFGLRCDAGQCRLLQDSPGELLIWFGDDPFDVGVRAFPTQVEALMELGRLLAAEPPRPHPATAFNA